MVCSNFISPFDFNCVFVNTLSGNLIIFLFLALLGILIVGARFRMTGFILSGMLCLFGLAIYNTASWVFITSFVFLLAYLGYMLTRFGRGG